MYKILKTNSKNLQSSKIYSSIILKNYTQNPKQIKSINMKTKLTVR